MKFAAHQPIIYTCAERTYAKSAAGKGVRPARTRHRQEHHAEGGHGRAADRERAGAQPVQQRAAHRRGKVYGEDPNLTTAQGYQHSRSCVAGAAAAGRPSGMRYVHAVQHCGGW